MQARGRGHAGGLTATGRRRAAGRRACAFPGRQVRKPTSCPSAICREGPHRRSTPAARARYTAHTYPTDRRCGGPRTPGGWVFRCRLPSCQRTREWLASSGRAAAWRGVAWRRALAGAGAPSAARGRHKRAHNGHSCPAAHRYTERATRHQRRSNQRPRTPARAVPAAPPGTCTCTPRPGWQRRRCGAQGGRGRRGPARRAPSARSADRRTLRRLRR